MELTLTLQSDAISEETLYDITRDLCRTLNQETEVRATLPEAAPEPGARGAWIPAVIHIIFQGAQMVGGVVKDYQHDVLAHSIGLVIGESVLIGLKPIFERHPSLKATVRDKVGNERVLDLKSVQPDNLRQTAKDLDALIGLS
ncbi:MAG: hypothetical protein WCA20_17730 [Candidatus Sulfotelmatobacter sp.]